jgi:thermitase
MLTAFTVALFGLWIATLENKALASKMSLLFFISLFGTIALTYFTSISFLTFLPKVIASFVILAVTGAMLNMMKDNKIAQWMLLAFCVLATYQLERKVNHLFSVSAVEAENKIDSRIQFLKNDVNGEVLIEVSAKHLSKLKNLLVSENAVLTRAFLPQSSLVTNLDDYYVIDIPKETNHVAFLAKLQTQDFIEWVENNEIIPMMFPQKNNIVPESDKTKLTNDPSVQMQWHLQHMEMEKYYTYFRQTSLKPIKKTKLFILDTGIDGSHEDLNKPEGPKDKNGHGTHCAGVAVAITNNEIGVASMSPSPIWVSVHGIQVIGDVGFGTQQQIIAGIIQAADSGADVISMSLGGITNQEREKAYNDAVKYANHKGAIVVVAAGNANMDGKRFSPANAENVIVVSSINEKNEKSGFSNHVQNLNMGIAAPGERILSTTPSNTYTSYNGTSMAAPQVAALIAIMKALRPDMTTQQAFQFLQRTGKETQNTLRTGKLINPLAVIQSISDIN